MTAPEWIDALVRQFGESAGLSRFSLNDKGVASVRFETGVSLHFEYASETLTLFVTVPARNDAKSASRILAYAHPAARRGFTVRSGYLARTGKAIFAVRLQEREVTLPVLNAVFAELWRIATEFGGEN